GQGPCPGARAGASKDAGGPRPAGRGRAGDGPDLPRDADEGGSEAGRARGSGAQGVDEEGDAEAAAGEGGRGAGARASERARTAADRTEGRGGVGALHRAARFLPEPGGGGCLLGSRSRGGPFAPDRRGRDPGQGGLLSRPGRRLRLARGSVPLSGGLATGGALRRHRHAGGRVMEIKRVPKPWGHELWWAHTEHYVGKILVVKAGHKLSLQYHEVKDETVYLHSGEAVLSVEEGGRMVERRLRPGDAYRIRPGIRHRIQAIQDSEIFEVSTPQVDDVVRLDDDYGRKGR